MIVHDLDDLGCSKHFGHLHLYIYIAIQHPIELRMERDDIESYKINENHVYIYTYVHGGFQSMRLNMFKPVTWGS